MPVARKKLIEVALPLEAINAAAARATSIRKLGSVAVWKLMINWCGMR
jgi:hypothetical protein